MVAKIASTQQDFGVEWAGSAPTERMGVMLARYRRLAAQDEHQRTRNLRIMVEAEYRLADYELREFTAHRLRAWLEFPPEQRAIIAQSYDKVMAELSAGPAMRRVMVVQSVIASMSAEEQEQLRAILPQNVCGAALEPRDETKRAAPIRRRWGFWRR